MRDVPETLLADAKNYLDITWPDPDGDVKLYGILLRGVGYLDHAAGVELDYRDGTAARALLFDYARYVRAGAFQDFGRDFSSELLDLHIAGEVSQRETCGLRPANGGPTGKVAQHDGIQ